MRVKKQKRHRKVVRFFSACFGFREPFKVLSDGTFVHHLLLHRLTLADDALSRLLGGRALLLTTRAENLGESHSESLEAALQLITARCDHERKVSAMACIESVIGEGNSEHFFVATQDADIRKKFQEVPGIPVIYGLRNSLFIKQPSALQRECVKSSQEKRLHVNESEYQELLKTELKDEFANDSGGKVLEEALRKINTAKRMLDVAEKSKFKRKKAKGPNPLSCKKKKMKDDSSVTLNEDGHAGAAKKRKRIRKRKRTHKNNVGEPGSYEKHGA